jgi:REP element-mobilizing transposase RayT
LARGHAAALGSPGKEQLWTSAYYVGTAGHVSTTIIKRYIVENQGK